MTSPMVGVGVKSNVEHIAFIYMWYVLCLIYFCLLVLVMDCLIVTFTYRKSWFGFAYEMLDDLLLTTLK